MVRQQKKKLQYQVKEQADNVKYVMMKRKMEDEMKLVHENICYKKVLGPMKLMKQV